MIAPFVACVSVPALPADTSLPVDSSADADSSTEADSAGDTAPPPPDTSADTGEDLPIDYRLPGIFDVVPSSGSFATSSGCVLDYALFEPEDATGAPLVVLAHGLERSLEQMGDWAEHYAAWGVPVATPTQCHCTVTDLDQAQNAADIVELAAALTPGPVVYAGHSAGGLSALIAGSADPRTTGIVVLDTPEWNGLGVAAAPAVTAPAFGLLGDPGVCNLYNNLPELFALLPHGGTLLRLTDADHCDFERPTDWVCTLSCGTSTNDRFTDEQIQETMLGLTTALLVTWAGFDDATAEWWEEDGRYYEELVATGKISTPTTPRPPPP